MKKSSRARKKVAFFGNFNAKNFGNEITFQTIFYRLNYYMPDTQVICISTGQPESVATSDDIKVIPIWKTFFESWLPRNQLLRLARRIFVGVPSDLWRWVACLVTLLRTDVLIIPGTGLLTDAYGLTDWGPYSIFRWSLLAKVCHCKLLFVAVGAGPLYGTLGSFFVRTALHMADFRSYRDVSSQRCLQDIGFPANKDQVCPDLVFSFPEVMIPCRSAYKDQRTVVGLGMMEYAGRYSLSQPNNTTYSTYLEKLVWVAQWLVAHENDVRLLIGAFEDIPTTNEFGQLLVNRLPESQVPRIINEPAASVQNLLSQIVSTEIVIATRFHNVLLALICEKPVISISFHHKCEALMSSMGLSAYCLDINDFQAEKLIEKFREVETNAAELKARIRGKVREFRKDLEKQYELLFDMCGPSQRRPIVGSVMEHDQAGPEQRLSH